MIEDEIFDSMSKMKKSYYKVATHPHQCSMCGEEANPEKVRYMLKNEYVDELDPLTIPYLFICEECYKELPD